MTHRSSPFSVSVSPFPDWSDGKLATSWDRATQSLDGTDTTLPESLADVAEVLFQGETGDTWDGDVVAVFRLNDGRFVAYETYYGPTGDGFCEDAYGGDAVLAFAADLRTVVNLGLSDEGRRLAGVPQELWNE